MPFVIAAVIAAPFVVLATSLWRGGKIGTRWNQGGGSLAERDKRLRGDQP